MVKPTLHFLREPCQALSLSKSYQFILQTLLQILLQRTDRRSGRSMWTYCERIIEIGIHARAPKGAGRGEGGPPHHRLAGPPPCLSLEDLGSSEFGTPEVGQGGGAGTTRQPQQYKENHPIKVFFFYKWPVALPGWGLQIQNIPPNPELSPSRKLTRPFVRSK